MMKNYCIIGTGVAAVHAAKAIRDQDPDGHIAVYGAEQGLPYNRIKLSKDLFADLHSEKVLIKKDKWYDKQGIQVFPNTGIERIDMEQHMLVTAAGERLDYDKLLICTGAKNRKLTIAGVDKQGVFSIRERHEADAFKAYIEDKLHVAIVGGGIQGLETAWSLLKAGKKVTIIEAGPRLMARQLDERASSRLKETIEAWGAQVYVQASIQKIVGEESVTGIMVNNEVIPCDSVAYAIGVIPNLDLVLDIAIETNRGIVVNDQMETSGTDIYAAGDVTEWRSIVDGLWDCAMEQGKIAGHNMASTEARDYQRVIPLTVFNAFDLPMFTMGVVDESQCDMTMIEEDETGKYTRLFIKNNQIVGVISLESVVAAQPYKAAIDSQASVEGLALHQLTIQEVMRAIKDRECTTVE